MSNWKPDICVYHGGCDDNNGAGTPAGPDDKVEPGELIYMPPGSMGTVYKLTMRLRWREGILEQAWQADDGSVEWQPVEVVNEPDK